MGGCSWWSPELPPRLALGWVQDAAAWALGTLLSLTGALLLPHTPQSLPLPGLVICAPLQGCRGQWDLLVRGAVL